MNSLKGWDIGFIGLGLMGKPMASNIKKAGANIIVFNRSKSVLQEFEKEGFRIATTPAQAGEAEFVICMVSNTTAVKEVLFGENGVVANIQPDAVFIDMGTTEVEATREFASKLEKCGVNYIDAPVSGGEIGAIEGTLSIMVGAYANSLSRVKPIFNVIGQQIIHVGGIGCGQIAKAANQIIVGLTINAVAEAFALARDGGADLYSVHQALKGGFADSKILQVHGKRMVDGEFKPGGTAITQHKDLDQALNFAAANEIELPATVLCRDHYKSLIEQGYGGLDHSALFKLYDPD